MAGTLIDNKLALRMRDATIAVEQSITHSGGAPQFTGDGPPLLACLLLEELLNGKTAKAAVLQFTENQVQIVSVVGWKDDENGNDSFILRWAPNEPHNGPKSSPIKGDATADEVYRALLNIPYFGPRDIEVHMGDSGIRRWLVEFKGRYAGQDIPLMVAFEDKDNNLGGNAEAQVTAESFLEDSGRDPITLRSVIPCQGFNGASPLRPGAICIAGWIPGIGYAPIAVEPRDYDFDNVY